MNEEMLLVCAGILEKKRGILKRRRLLSSLRAENDAFDMSESVFVQNFRFPKSLCRELIQQLDTHTYDTQKSSLKFKNRFLACLHFYAHGSYQKCVGNSYPISMSQSSVSRALAHISKLIVDVKGSEIHFPKTSEELGIAKKGFYNMFGVKGTIGAVDCTHIGIISPPTKDTQTPLSLYMNRKGYYSINVEAACDHRLQFTAVNARFPGSCHDSGIWTTSPIRMQLLGNFNPQQDTWLLGDQGYPLEPWLLTPVAEPSNIQEVTYNKIHAKARNSTERGFGVLKSQFRCLSKHRILHYDHQKAANIIYACVILHNILLKHCAATDIVEEEEADDDVQNSENMEIAESGYLREGQRIRSRYIMSLQSRT